MALELQPERGAEAHLTLGRIYMERQDWDPAVEHFREATLADRENEEAYNNLGVTYARRGNPIVGLAAIRLAIRISPEWDAARQNFELMREDAANVIREAVGSAPSREIAAGRFIALSYYQGDLDNVAARFDAKLQEGISMARLEKMHVDTFRQLGAEREVLDEQLIPGNGSQVYRRRVRFERRERPVDVLVQLTPELYVTGFELRPVDGNGSGGARS